MGGWRQTFLWQLLLVFLAIPVAWGSEGPLAQVQSTVDEVLVVLKGQGLAGEAKREKLSALVRPRFDFPAMSQWVLGIHWRKASADERARFVGLFTDILEETYLSKIEKYTDEKVQFVEERIDGDKAEVDTTVKSAGADIPIRYKLYRKGDQWLVYDVVIEEVSLVRNFRSTYDEIARKKGMDGLLDQMAKKLDEMRNGQAGGTTS